VAKQHLNPLTILHVEDDENDALLFAKACDRAGLPVILQRVRDAEDGRTYLLGEGNYTDRLRFPLPQIIILDLKLPRMSGFEFLIWIRKEATLATLPVLVFTSSLSREDKSRALAEGANSYFVKPATFEALVQMVEFFRAPDPNHLN
jgi:DNA-binding response OmpR family regulator